ncbi:MAG: hypothetical protein MJ193_01295 [Clostridia bacterium]|nr:hypothetical protein [Clostridia bacterium]
MEFLTYKNYGKCVRFERNGIIALVTVEIGPRIIYYGTDGLNFMNEDIDRNVKKGGEFFDKTYRDGEMWYLYGGHRVWKSPEDMPTYTPDNYPVEYTIDTDGFGGTFTCPVKKFFEYSLVIRMSESGGLEVRNIVKRENDGQKYAVWALSVLAKGGTLNVPLNDMVDELNPSQNIVLWPYDDLKDERVDLDHKLLTVRQTDKVDALKLGLLSKKGRAYYTIGDKTLKVQVESPDLDAKYSDFGCNFETYTNCHILEMEWLSPIVEKGGKVRAELVEKFEILSNLKAFD